MIKVWTNWLRSEEDLNAARIALLLREKGLDTKTIICARIFPDTRDPTGGVVITPDGRIFQFGFNRAGMRAEMAAIDVWLNITQTYGDHPWRDDVLEGLALLNSGRNTQRRSNNGQEKIDGFRMESP